MSNYRQKFNQINVIFQQNPTQQNHEAIAQFYALKEELEQRGEQNSFDDDMVLFAVYNALRFYKSALYLYMKHHDVNDPENLSKFAKIGGKANSHGDNFILKNIKQEKNQLKKRKTKISLTLDNFIPSKDYDFDENHDKQAFFINKNIPIFWRNFKSAEEKIDVIVPKNSLEIYLEKIQETVEYFAYFDEQTLINHYNNPPQNHHSWTIQNTGQTADENWFNSLEIYRFQIDINQNGKADCRIEFGDIYDLDHILEMDFWDKELFRFSYS